AGAVERRHQEIAGAADAIAGEDAAGAVGAVRRWRETHEQQARARIAGAGHRPAPVGLVAIGAPLLLRDTRAVVAQSRTAITLNDRLMYFGQSCQLFSLALGPHPQRVLTLMLRSR